MKLVVFSPLTNPSILDDPLQTLEYKEIKIFTGNLTREKIRILNSKKFFILFNGKSSKITPRLRLEYQRCGNSYEINNPSTEKPVKKETVYQIYLKGKNLNDYSNDTFALKVKEGIKETAKNYCIKNNIKFNGSIPVYENILEKKKKFYFFHRNESVNFHHVSLCPFEWPDQDICAFIEHSVYVSGEKDVKEVADAEYELTSEHLEDMWKNWKFPELEELGITVVAFIYVFKLPELSEVILWWAVIIGVAVGLSLIALFLFWKIEKGISELFLLTFRKLSVKAVLPKIVKTKNKSKTKVSKRQKVPSFMLTAGTGSEKNFKSEEFTLKFCNIDNLLNNKSDVNQVSSESPIKIFFCIHIGGFFFGTNKAFEDDDDDDIQETTVN
ncbi:hypothetical protein Phum_PHUM371430 [Pediculus humanus corporis]|uniref:Uncharacterized protein n=1 Tax=Pediculus humanus subsp. corporis TaxID=121224 RepID=E0VQ51_PEDHC|nr:uncharacterized protein Phum_PHUM371430 [Pediculus humanus corporis]EEB15507.1 hypothetical protein Phum_PHUM371430 [Pediculus humanus corporis]